LNSYPGRSRRLQSRDPATLEDAVRLAATLTDNHVKAGTLTKKGTKKEVDKDTTEPSKEVKAESSGANKKKQKNNNHNFVVTT
jgi:hypothetical protein